MRQLIFLPIMILLFGTGTAFAQICTPVDTFSSSGTADGSDMGCITQGEQYDATYYFKAPDSIRMEGGSKVAMDYMIIDSLKNLPCGISWATNNRNGSLPSNKFMSAEDGCIRVKGTTSDSIGLYEIGVGATIKLSQSSNPITLSADSVKDKINWVTGVKKPSDSCSSAFPSNLDKSNLPDSLTRTSSCYTSWSSANSNVEGTVFDDANGDGSFDAGETKLEDWLVKITPGPVYATTNSKGDYSASLPTGSYTVELVTPSYWNVTGSSSYNITISDKSDKKTGKDFGVEKTSSVEDLSIDATAGVPVAGQNTMHWLSVKNSGTDTITGTVTFNLDSNLIFQSATPSPKSVNGNTVKWDVSDLKVMEKRTIEIESEVETAPYETPMTSSTKIEPKSTDNTPSDNVDTLDQKILSSYDPNDKLASPSRKSKRGMASNYTLFDEELEYTVRFQNTGNYKASLVRIEDTLDEDVDVSTFELIGTSHAVDYEINGQGNVIFTFKNINLPDSGRDLQGSKGFVKYSVQAKDDVQEETKVHNNAHIYFDYNPAVVTNTTQNTMVSELPSTTTSVTTLDGDKLTSKISPNPFNNSFRVSVEDDGASNYTFELYNMMGKKLKHKEVSDSKIVDVQANDLSSGMYLYTIKLEDGRQSTGKIIAE